MFKQKTPKNQRDLYFFWHISTDCSLTTIWELLLEVLCKNGIKTGNNAIKTPTDVDFFFFLSKEQTYRCCLKLALSCPWAISFILDLKELTAEVRQQLKYSRSQAQNFSGQKCEIGHDHLSIWSWNKDGHVSSFLMYLCYTEVSQYPPTLQQVLTILNWFDNELQASFF